MKPSKKALAKGKKQADIERQLKKKCCELIGGYWVIDWLTGQRSCFGFCQGCGKHRRLELSHEPPKGMGGTTAEYSTDEDAEHRVTLKCHTCHIGGEHHEKIITDSGPEWGIK